MAYKQSGDHKAQVAQEFYQAWLRTRGIEDSEAIIIWNRYLGFVGVVGQNRTEHDGPYEILPEELLIEINRRADRKLPLNPTLVERLDAAIPR